MNEITEKQLRKLRHLLFEAMDKKNNRVLKH